MLFRKLFSKNEIQIKENHFKELPEEIIFLIFSYLNKADMYHVSQSCQLFNGLSQNENLKQYFQAQHTNYKTIAVHRKINFKDTKKLSIEGGIALYGSLFVATAANNALGIYDFDTKKCVRLLKGHKEPINNIIKLSNAYIASSSDDCTIRLWDVETGKCVKKIVDCKKHLGGVKNIAKLSSTQIVSLSYLSNDFYNVRTILSVIELDSGNFVLSLRNNLIVNGE